MIECLWVGERAGAYDLLYRLAPIRIRLTGTSRIFPVSARGISHTSRISSGACRGEHSFRMGWRSSPLEPALFQTLRWLARMFTSLEGHVVAARSGLFDPGLILGSRKRSGMPPSELAATLEHWTGCSGSPETLACSSELQGFSEQRMFANSTAHQ